MKTERRNLETKVDRVEGKVRRSSRSGFKTSVRVVIREHAKIESGWKDASTFYESKAN
jgi:hypothetical protein